MHGSIVQRGKKFAVVLYAGRDPENPSKERRKWYHGFETRRDAEAFRVTLASHPAFSAGLGLYGSNRLRTGDYLDRWLKSHASTGAISETTEDWYRLVREKHLKPVIGHVPLARLSPQTIQELYSALVEKGLSKTSVRHIANQLHLALNHAVRRGLIVRNPSDSTDPPSRDTKPTTTLTPEQLRTFLNDTAANASPNVSALYVLLAGTGLRFGEALGLRDEDLNLDAGVLSVQQTLKKSGRLGKPKTDRSRRTITLPDEVVSALRRVRKWKVEQKLRLGPKFRDCGLVFCTPRGQSIHQNNLRRCDFYPRLKRLGLPRIRIHDLRHTHGTQLIAAGVDHRTVADRLGHSSPAFTMATYIHGVSESQRRAAEVANALLGTANGLQQSTGGSSR